MTDDLDPLLSLDPRRNAAARALAASGAALATLDEAGRVADLSDAARALVGVGARPLAPLASDPARGARLDGLVAGAGVLFRELRKGRDAAEVTSIAAERSVHVRAEALRDDEGALLGALLTLRVAEPAGDHDARPRDDGGRRAPAGNRLVGLVGQSPAMRLVFERLSRAAPSDVTVLLTGESGTGKEVAARALHTLSARADGPFQAVHCAALSPGLLEAELFGHAAGAFTGAARERIGLIEAAGGGTLFLDEVGELSPELQVKLLRVLQEREVTRVGESRPRPVDVRLVSATNRDLRAALATGRLREDFFYRIAVFEVRLPALRERPEDVPLLARHVLAELAARAGREPVRVAPEAMEALLAYTWPGNVRELRNALEAALVTCDDGALAVADLPLHVRHRSARTVSWSPSEEADRRALSAALERYGWNRTRTAEALGMSRVTLWKKIRRYALEQSIYGALSPARDEGCGPAGERVSEPGDEQAC
ncbi:MAG: sigma 54-interacting transcriptional regulator [Planctomycetota bacterium]